MTENPLHSPLVDEWGFNGVVISDWYAARAADEQGAVRGGLGLDARACRGVGRGRAHRGARRQAPDACSTGGRAPIAHPSVVRATPGAEVIAQVHLAPRAFQHWSAPDRRWATEPGVFRALVGRSVSDLLLAADIIVEPGK
jgi:hypothetical protein